MNGSAATGRNNLIIAAILIVGLVVGLAIAGGDLSRLPLQDDSFYNFSIARNLALGHGPTYDGVHETNGFHPIVVGTMSVLYRVFEGDTEKSVHVLLIMMVLVNLATVFIFMRMVSRLVAQRAGLILGFLWIVSPYYWWMFLNGMDTGINIMLTIASLSVYLGRIREREKASMGTFLALGMVLGFVVLSRMDGLLLVGVIGLDVLIRSWRRGGAAAVKRSVTGLAVLSVCVCVVVGPWVKFNIDLTGSPVQISGQAIRFLSVLKLPKDRAIEEEAFFDRESDLARINRERVDRFNQGRPLEPSFYV
ncbi:glycosyltransferase family 39 protein, partial [Thermodesulfobacteriota bacterium]